MSVQYECVCAQISAMFREENSVARCVSDDDVKRVFLSVEPIRALSQDVLDKLAERVAQWCALEKRTRIGDRTRTRTIGLCFCLCAHKRTS